MNDHPAYTNRRNGPTTTYRKAATASMNGNAPKASSGTDGDEAFKRVLGSLIVSAAEAGMIMLSLGTLHKHVASGVPALGYSSTLIIVLGVRATVGLLAHSIVDGIRNGLRGGR